MSGCTFEPTRDFSCYKIPTAANTACPAGVTPQGSMACDVPHCTLCNSTRRHRRRQLPRLGRRAQGRLVHLPGAERGRACARGPARATRRGRARWAPAAERHGPDRRSRKQRRRVSWNAHETSNDRCPSACRGSSRQAGSSCCSAAPTTTTSPPTATCAATRSRCRPRTCRRHGRAAARRISAGGLPPGALPRPPGRSGRRLIRPRSASSRRAGSTPPEGQVLDEPLLRTKRRRCWTVLDGVRIQAALDTCRVVKLVQRTASNERVSLVAHSRQRWKVRRHGPCLT